MRDWSFFKSGRSPQCLGEPGRPRPRSKSSGKPTVDAPDAAGPLDETNVVGWRKRARYNFSTLGIENDI